MSSPVLLAPWWADVDAELGDTDLPRRRIVPWVSRCRPGGLLPPAGIRSRPSSM
ncbi:hypothetical protein [Sorangium sp. So ce887]|uniref:hypothetical protein n=1 Tax=Sorangium sp. So ce887 TaxID=3133324 RepID=UPI003F5F2C79